MWTRSSRVREWDLEEKADEIYNRVKGSRQPERWGVRNVSNDQNLSQTAAIDVLFSINFAVVFDFIYFRFRPSKAKWIGNVLPNRQNAANYLQRFFFWINFMCSHPLWFWGRDTLAFGRGGGGVPIPTRGQTLLYSRYVCTLYKSIVDESLRHTERYCLRHYTDATTHLAPLGNAQQYCSVFNFQLVFRGIFLQFAAHCLRTQTDLVRQ